METVKLLLQFIEAYDQGTSLENKICREIIDIKFNKQKILVEMPKKNMS